MYVLGHQAVLALVLKMELTWNDPLCRWIYICQSDQLLSMHFNLAFWLADFFCHVRPDWSLSLCASGSRRQGTAWPPSSLCLAEEAYAVLPQTVRQSTIAAFVVVEVSTVHASSKIYISSLYLWPSAFCPLSNKTFQLKLTFFMLDFFP